MEFTKENGYAKEKDFIDSVNGWLKIMEMYSVSERKSHYSQSFYACHERVKEALGEMKRRGWSGLAYWRWV